jgi:NTP pyrophosphatase (non-canonical NTP hydrolase)
VHEFSFAPTHYSTTHKLTSFMNDTTTTLAELREAVRRFVDERDWQQFHAPKNLSMSLAIEAAELMERFQWISAEESRRAADDPAKRTAIAEELADVVCYTLALANELNIDLAAAFADKMRKNAQKYPAEEYRGRYGPEDK